ncbi:hypothetical protein L484_003134 [Morus notabilis]|uniref:Uncharacterized protein n=1 Tax=Morus notabilis TaxID=981085 RepID=W9QP68_9ROSA|nr:hypothetical protein L484_003134 [Morus notabilis]
MSTEEFHRIPLPDNVQRVNSYLKRLAVWNESVSLFFSPEKTQNSLSFEIWVMNDYSTSVEGPSWTKHSTVGPLVGIHSPIAFWKRDELLMDTKDGGVVSYNLGTKRLRDFPIYGVRPGSCHAENYMGNLLSFKRKGTRLAQMKRQVTLLCHVE